MEPNGKFISVNSVPNLFFVIEKSKTLNQARAKNNLKPLSFFLFAKNSGVLMGTKKADGRIMEDIWAGMNYQESGKEMNSEGTGNKFMEDTGNAI